MNHDAIRALYPNVKIIDDTAGIFDADGNTVEIDEKAVNAWVDPNAYKVARSQAYPSIPDQLDQIYHEGIDAWKETIAAIKAEHPKP